MSDIEKEFFEAFAIEKTGCKTCVYGSKKWQDCKNEMGVACPEEKYTYPPITADIVLGLEEIIINKCYNLVLNKAEDDYPYQYETKDFFTDWYKTQEEALLSLCIGLKDEIQHEVRNLFNGQ